MSEQAGNESKQTDDPHGGISSSATTADELTPDSQVPGVDYGNTGQETVQQAEEEG